MCEFVGMRDLASAGTSVGSEAQNGLRGLHSLCASDRFLRLALSLSPSLPLALALSLSLSLSLLLAMSFFVNPRALARSALSS